MNPDLHYLGKLCPQGHDHEGTGRSLRLRSGRACLGCIRECVARRRKARTPEQVAATKAYNDAWRARNPKRCGEYVMRHKAKNENYRIAGRLRCRLAVAFKVRGLAKRERASKYGISWAAIVAHLGPQPGPDYEVDHIKPLAAFDLTDPAQLREACRPENHQWLLVGDNRRKGARFDG